jgi:PAS domain S-box-containing protein
MNLRLKTLAFLTVLTILISIVVMGLSATIFLNNYTVLETRHIHDYSLVILKNIGNEQNDLEMIVTDWGAWNDAYRFASSGDPGFTTNNFMPETFENLHLNFIVMTNRSGGIIYDQGFDFANDTFAPPRPDLIAEVSRNGSPLHAALMTDGNLSGLLSLPGGAVLLAAYPVLRSDYSGPPAGMVIMGRYIDDTEKERLAMVENSEISIVPVGQSSLPPAETDALTSGSSPAFIRYPGNDIIEEDILLRDVTGNSSLVLEHQMQRTIYQQGRSTVLSFIFILLGIVLILGIFLIWLLESLVLRRLGRINQEIEGITGQDGSTARITDTGDDEISRLVDALNRMLELNERSRTELMESEKRFRECTEQLPEIFVELDTAGRLTYANNAAEVILGDPLVGGETRTFFDMIDPEDRERAQVDFARVLQGESLDGIEYTLLRYDGSRFHAILSSRPITYQGTRIGTRITAGDISDRKQMEDALRLINTKMNLLNQITRHDVRNQLTALTGFLELTLASTTDPEVLRYLDIQLRAARTIEQQIAFTKDYQDIGVRVPQWQNVRETILSAVSPFDPSLVSVSDNLGHIEVYADGLFGKVFYNLVDNATRYGEKVTLIRFSSEKTTEGLVIVCEDDGVGIPAEKKEGIFTRKYYNNSGFGLFLSREILAITGLAIRETGSYGHGARFEIVVPGGKYRMKDE